MIQHTTRRLLSKIHLYLGLSFGIVFVLLGLTGSALAWRHELDAALNPELLHVQPAPGLRADDSAPVTPAAIDALVARLAADPLYGKPSQLTLPEHADAPVIATYRRQGGAAPAPFELEVSRQVMVDPTTLRVLGERNWGEIGFSRPLLMPTLFHLHHYLLGGDWGKTVAGVAGLVMAIAALTGLALWLPKATMKALRQALTISYRGSLPRFNHSFHRAAGFFAAPVLLVMGVTGLYFNLPKWVTPVVSSVAQMAPADKLANRAAPAGKRLEAGQAVAIVQQLMPQARVSRVALPAKLSAPFELRVRQPGEVRKGDGATRIFIDAYSGEVLRVRDPLRAAGGDTFLNWFFPLHTGEAFGTAGRVFISAFGIVPALFFATGFALWWRRRSSHAAINSASNIRQQLKGNTPA
jgi:uncharacterized iron-regulated membrane protein